METSVWCLSVKPKEVCVQNECGMLDEPVEDRVVGRDRYLQSRFKSAEKGSSLLFHGADPSFSQSIAGALPWMCSFGDGDESRSVRRMLFALLVEMLVGQVSVDAIGVDSFLTWPAREMASSSVVFDAASLSHL